MSAVHPILQHFTKLTEFLGLALGPDYEVALHDLTDKDRSIIAIANNHVSGRSIGAPLTNMALNMIHNKTYESQDHMIHYHGISVNGKALRSSTMYIKDGNRLIGMLCINFDDSRYQHVIEQVLSLCHPDPFITELMPDLSSAPSDLHAAAPVKEAFRNSSDAVAMDAVNAELEHLGVSPERLTSDERLRIISALESDGIFLFKGAVKDVAEQLQCSQASVYRYLSQIRQERNR